MIRQWRRWIGYLVIWLLCMLVPIGIAALANWFGTPNQSSDFTVGRFDGDYRLSSADGGLRLDVTESLVVSFASYTMHGITRTLPTRYHDTDLGLTGVSVTDESGQRVGVSTTSNQNSITLRIGDAGQTVHGAQHYVISYSYTNAMAATRAGGQELYLDLNGTGWTTRIDQLTAAVHVDPGLSGRLDGKQACYRGRAGSTSRCQIVRDGSDFTVSASGLAPAQNVTIAIGFQPGTVSRTLPPAQSPSIFAQIGMLWLPLWGLLLLGIALLVRAVQRHPGFLRRQVIVTSYDPPEGINPMVAADLIGHPERGMAALLTDQAIKGTLTVTDSQPEAAPAMDPKQHRRELRTAPLRQRLTVRLLDPSAATSDSSTSASATSPSATSASNQSRSLLGGDPQMMDRYVRQVLKPLFGDKRGWSLDRPPYEADIAESSRARGQMFDYANLRRDSSLPSVLLYGGLIGALMLGWAVLITGSGNLWLFLACGLLGMLAVVAAGYYCPASGRLTSHGREVLLQLAGLRQFIMMAEADRVAWLNNVASAPRDPQGRITLLERLLPWAVVFGAEQTWRQVIGDQRSTLPQAPGVAAFAPELSILLTQATVTPSSPWYQQRPSYLMTRPEWGEGAVASTLGDWRQSWSERNSDSGDSDGGWHWGGGSGSSSSFSSWGSGGGSASGGGGFSGGGIGGGGGSGW